MGKSSSILQKLHDFTDEFGTSSPLNSVTKLHALVTKAGGGSAGLKRVEWLFELLMDLFRRGALPAEKLSKALLLGPCTGDGQRRVGVADILLTKLDLLHDVLVRVRGYLPSEVFYDLQENCGSVALYRILEKQDRPAWPPSAKAAQGVIGCLVYDTIWDDTILSWLRGRKPRTALWKRKDFEEIVKTLSGFDDEASLRSKAVDDSHAKELDEDLRFGLLSDLALQEKLSELRQGDQLDVKRACVLEEHLQHIKAKVQSLIKLVNEQEPNEYILAELKRFQLVGDVDSKRHVLIYYSPGDAGESVGNPRVYEPALRGRGTHAQRFLQVTMERHEAEPRALHAADLYFVNDIGKDGNKTQLLGSFCHPPEDQESKGRMVHVSKKVRKLLVLFTERSLCERLDKVRGHSAICQTHNIYVVSRKLPHLNSHDRLYQKGGTNRGNVLGPFDADSWSSSAACFFSTFLLFLWKKLA